MDRTNLPSLRNDRDQVDNEGGQSIFENTAIDPYITSQYNATLRQNAENKTNFRNKHNVSKKSTEKNSKSGLKADKNNYFKLNNMNKNNRSRENLEAQNQIVPVGYFDNDSAPGGRK